MFDLRTVNSYTLSIRNRKNDVVVVQDEVIAIDLEWRPVFTKSASSRVAMVQLASSTIAVLIRTCRLRTDKIAPALQDFLM
jgi:hypothetical protein